MKVTKFEDAVILGLDRIIELLESINREQKSMDDVDDKFEEYIGLKHKDKGGWHSVKEGVEDD